MKNNISDMYTMCVYWADSDTCSYLIDDFWFPEWTLWKYNRIHTRKTWGGEEFHVEQNWMWSADGSRDSLTGTMWHDRKFSKYIIKVLLLLLLTSSLFLSSQSRRSVKGWSSPWHHQHLPYWSISDIDLWSGAEWLSGIIINYEKGEMLIY